jgi:hypothetical protein
MGDLREADLATGKSDRYRLKIGNCQLKSVLIGFLSLTSPKKANTIQEHQLQSAKLPQVHLARNFQHPVVFFP